MNFRKAILLGILLLFGSSVYAQEQKVEVFGEYSYLRFNPTLSYLKETAASTGRRRRPIQFHRVLRD